MPDKSPLTLPTLPNVENIDSSKINLAGYYDKEHPEIANQIDQFMDERNKYINSLEERYKNPNWFKIAAGFAKPQLGGFLASLGSASEAAGEQLELQRAVAPTIAKMRAENSIFGSNLAQKNVQQQLFNEWEKGGSKDLKLAGRIYNLDPSSPAAKAVKSVIENASTQAGTQSKPNKQALENKKQWVKIRITYLLIKTYNKTLKPVLYNKMKFSKKVF